jgi:hypothetical protein
MCMKCMKTDELIQNARLACLIAGRLDIERVLFDLQEEINKH